MGKEVLPTNHLYKRAIDPETGRDPILLQEIRSWKKAVRSSCNGSRTFAMLPLVCSAPFTQKDAARLARKTN